MTEVIKIADTIVEIESFIGTALESKHPLRFRAVSRLAIAADALLNLNEPQAAASSEMGSALALLAPVVASMKDRLVIETRRLQAEELDALVKVKATLMESGEGLPPAAQDRIDTLKKGLG